MTTSLTSSVTWTRVRMGGESGYAIRQERESACVACAQGSSVKAAAAWSRSRSAARSAMKHPHHHHQAIGIFDGLSVSRHARATGSRSSNGRCRQRMAGGGARRPGCQSSGRRLPIRAARKGDRSSSTDSPNEEATPMVKAAWYASEVFGKAVALVRGSNQEREDDDWEEEEGRLSREETIAALRADYARSYFVTGKMSMGIYEDDCEFADPFVSFKGRQRFKQNVSNLGSFMREVNLTVVDWQEAEDKLTTKWRFSCVLALPWKPILAASGGTDHYFDKKTGKIYKHVERWDISPADGVRQLFKPNPKLRKKAGKSD